MSCIRQQQRCVSTWMNPFALCQIADNNYFREDFFATHRGPFHGQAGSEVLELCMLSANQRLDSHVPGFRKFDGEGSEHEVEKEALLPHFFWLSIFNYTVAPVCFIRKIRRSAPNQPTRGPPNGACQRGFRRSGRQRGCIRDALSRDCFNRWWSTGGDSPGWLKGLVFSAEKQDGMAKFEFGIGSLR